MRIVKKDIRMFNEVAKSLIESDRDQRIVVKLPGT
jgi:hypothetical protein